MMNKPQQSASAKPSDNRISLIKKVPASRLNEEKKQISDDRFKAIYEDPAFQIDESREAHNTGAVHHPI